MGSVHKSIGIQAVGLVLVSLLMSQAAFGLPIEGEARSSPADPAQSCILPADSTASMIALPLLLSSVASTQTGAPAGTALELHGGRAEFRSPVSGTPATPPRSPARDLRQALIYVIPLGAHAPPTLV